MVDGNFVCQVLKSMCQKINEQKDYLTKLDQPIGDSDHGINMARGFNVVVEKLASSDPGDIGAVLKNAGMALVSSVGGASGPIYGSAFLKMGMALAGKQEMDMEDFMSAMEAAEEAVKQRGKAQLEDATMVDAMSPSIVAMKEALAGGKSKREILEEGCRAAWKGAEHTKDLIAKKGRASYVGERGLGHQDPGATSFAYLLEVVKDSL